MPITGGKIVLTDDEQAIETLHLGFTISPHEECGVEEAVRIVEAQGGEVVVLTLGPPEAEEQLRECLAIGADRAILLVTDERGVGRAGDCGGDRRGDAGRATAFDLIVFGNESADAGNYQVGIRVAYALGLPVVTGLKGLTVESGRMRCEQEAAGGRDVYDVPLPAVVTVLEGLNLPRYPSVPAKLRAGRSRWSSARRRGPSRSSRSCGSSCRPARASRPRSSATARTQRRGWSRSCAARGRMTSRPVRPDGTSCHLGREALA